MWLMASTPFAIPVPRDHPSSFLAAKNSSSAGSAHVTAVGRSKLRAAAAAADLEEDPKYAGKVVSASKALRMAADLRKADSEEEDSVDEEEGDDEEEQRSSRGKKASGKSRAKQRRGDSDEEMEEEEAEGGGAGFADDLDAELQALQAADAQALMRRDRDAVKEKERGQHVKHQLVSGEREMEGGREGGGEQEGSRLHKSRTRKRVICALHQLSHPCPLPPSFCSACTMLSWRPEFTCKSPCRVLPGCLLQQKWRNWQQGELLLPDWTPPASC